MCGPKGVGIVSSHENDVQSSFPTTGLDFDGIVCGGSLCTLSGRHCKSERQYGE